MFIYYVIQMTWGIIQNVAGLFVFLAFIRKKHYFYKNTVVTEWSLRSSSMGLGMFVFLGRSDVKDEAILAHEYGHTVQSMILGPAYTFVIGLPSLFWANSRKMARFRKKRGMSYYRFYPEMWANRIARRRIGIWPGYIGPPDNTEQIPHAVDKTEQIPHETDKTEQIPHTADTTEQIPYPADKKADKGPISDN